MTEERTIERGQVYYLREDSSIGAEISIGRPVLVLNNQELIDKLPTVTVAYMTTTPRAGMCHDIVKVFTGRKWSYTLLNQIRTIDKRRLTELMWTLPDVDMRRIETALSYTFSIGKFSNANVNENEDEDVKVNEDVEEVLDEVVEDNISELASLKMELALHKALYEKTLEKLIELRLEKDGVVEKPVVNRVRETEKEISDEEVTQILSSVNAKRVNLGGFGKAQLKKGARPININSASVEEFESIGINDQTARNIVNYRKRHGYFVSIEDLLMVPRFGRGCLATFASVLEV